MLMPNVLSIIGVTYTGEDRIKALSWYGLAMGLAAVSGQLIGGLLVQWNPAGLGWRSCFLINVPIGALALAVAPQLIRESRELHARRVDWVGYRTRHDRADRDRVPARRGPPARLAAVDVALARRGAAAARGVRRRISAGWHAWAGASRCSTWPCSSTARSARAWSRRWCSGPGQASFFLVLALYLQEGRGLSPLHAGLVFTVLAVSYLVASMRAPALAVRYGRRVLTRRRADHARGRAR